jgi:hypothetical protein
LELARKLGEVVSIDVVVATVAEHVSNCRSRLLALPSRLAPLVAIEDDADHCLKLLESGIYEALAELAAGDFPGGVTVSS